MGSWLPELVASLEAWPLAATRQGEEEEGRDSLAGRHFQFVGENSYNRPKPTEGARRDYADGRHSPLKFVVHVQA